MEAQAAVMTPPFTNLRSNIHYYKAGVASRGEEGQRYEWGMMVNILT